LGKGILLPFLSIRRRFDNNVLETLKEFRAMVADPY